MITSEHLELILNERNHYCNYVDQQINEDDCDISYELIQYQGEIAFPILYVQLLRYIVINEWWITGILLRKQIRTQCFIPCYGDDHKNIILRDTVLYMYYLTPKQLVFGMESF